MPGFLASLLLPIAINMVIKYGLPALELKWPNLVPLVQAVLAALGENSNPPQAVHEAAKTYAATCQGVGCPPVPVGNA